MDELLSEVHALLDRYRPARVAALGPMASAIVAAYRFPRQAQVERLAPTSAALEGRPRYEFALLAPDGGRLERREGGALIARLRDLQAARLAVIVHFEPGGWQEADMRALGLSVDARYGEGPQALVLCTYDVATYKRTPEWLNARHWAHPERWNKARW